MRTTYKVFCREYLLVALKKARSLDSSIPIDDIRWTPKKGHYEVVFPQPVNEQHKRALEQAGIRFIFT